MDLKISKADNGYLLEWYEEREEGMKELVYHTFEESPDKDAREVYKTQDDEKVALARMLYYVAEHFGYRYQKFEAENLNIDFSKRGHKNE